MAAVEDTSDSLSLLANLRPLRLDSTDAGPMPFTQTMPFARVRGFWHGIGAEGVLIRVRREGAARTVTAEYDFRANTVNGDPVRCAH